MQSPLIVYGLVGIAAVCVVILAIWGVRTILGNRSKPMPHDERDQRRHGGTGGATMIDRVVEGLHSEVRRLHEELAALRREVEDIRRAGRSHHEISPSADALAPTPSSHLNSNFAPLLASRQHEQPAGQSLQGMLNELERAYSAAGGNPKALSSFRDKYSAVNFENGRLTGDTGASFVWAVPLGSRHYALLPGYDLAMDFAVNYSSERSIPDTVKQAFEFEIDQARALRLLRAGIAQVGPDGSTSINQRGLIAGLSD